MAENPKTPTTIRTANQDVFNRGLRHQVGVRRFTSGEVKKALKLFEKADREIAALLRRRVAAIANGRQINTRRFKRLLDDIQEIRNEMLRQFRGEVRSSLNGLVPIEIDFEERILQDSIPVEIEFNTIQLDTVRAAIRSRPFSGGTDSARTLQQWFDSIKRADQRRLIEAIQLGVIQGESVDQIVRRVVGTRARGFSDGVLATTRRNAEALVRTAVNHISNAAREAVWDENSDIIQALKWVSTLDGRTSAICRARDGRLVAIGGKNLPTGFPALIPPTARPPAHPACRSLMIAVLDLFGIAGKISDRPFVRDTRTGRRRQRDFRREAREANPERWKNSTREERNAIVRARKESWAKENIGRVPADVSYGEWLLQQPHSFQNQVLGTTKARLFRTGRIPIDKFVDRRGNELTLDQLRQSHGDVFNEIGA